MKKSRKLDLKGACAESFWQALIDIDCLIGALNSLAATLYPKLVV